MNIQETLGLAPVAVYPKNKQDLNGPCKSLLYGVELEMEDVKYWEDWVMDGIIRVADGSLRNNGSEFITQPMNFTTLQEILTKFFVRNKVKESNVTERTSVHVHVNCQDLTSEQVVNICLIYQVVEKLLFAFAGKDREDSIFCVPWHQTTLSGSIFTDIHSILHKLKTWHKYTALNLLPLFEYGTVEFRHLAGQTNVEVILTWCRLIGHMVKYAKENTLEAVEQTLMHLNTNSQYKNLLDAIFKEDAGHLLQFNFTNLLEDGVLDFKFSILSKFNKKEVKSKPLDNDDTYARIRAQVDRAIARPRPAPLLRPAQDRDLTTFWQNQEARLPQISIDDLVAEFTSEEEGDF